MYERASVTGSGFIDKCKQLEGNRNEEQAICG